MTDRRPLPATARAALIATLAIVMGSLFLTTYTLALGHPTAHAIETALVGDASAHRKAVDALQRVASAKLVFVQEPTLAAAKHEIDEQQVYAALDVSQQPPTLYIASAAAASVARLLSRVSERQTPIRIVDTHPLPPSDPQGLDIFYLVLAATIIGFVTMFQIRANAAGLHLRHWTTFVFSFAAVASLVLTLVAGPLLHRLTLPQPESWGILALQILTAATFNSTMIVLIRRWAILPTWLLFVVLGNSSSGGAVAPPLLPRPFAIMSQWLPSGATVTTLRDAVYFRHWQHARPLLVLATWAVVWTAAMLVTSHRRGTSPGIT